MSYYALLNYLIFRFIHFFITLLSLFPFPTSPPLLLLFPFFSALHFLPLKSHLTFPRFLSPQKELAKPSLSPSFLSAPFPPPPTSLTSSISLPPCSLSSSPLLTTTASPLTPTISLHPRPPASSPLFTASFLRPAPGPIRTSQGSILFTPYWWQSQRRGV